MVSELKEVYEFPKTGNMPVRAQGTRWINHKRNALQRVVDRYGAYLNHLSTVAEDTTKSEDRARIKGYVTKWQHSRILIGAALYIDVLKPASLLSLSLQGEHLDVIQGIDSILKFSKLLVTLTDQNPLQWPTVKLVCSRVKEEKGEKLYQGAVLHNYNTTTLKHCSDQAIADAKQLDDKLRERLEWSDVRMLRAIAVFLNTQSWQCTAVGSDTEMGDNAEIKIALEYISSHFREPLEAKGINLSGIQDEIEEIVQYARKYLNLVKEGYQKIWYKLHIAPDVGKWRNILLISELLFSLPFSNGRIKSMFSLLKVIKTDRRTSLDTPTLSDLLEITMEGPAVDKFSAEHSVSFWWEDSKTGRRMKQRPRKQYEHSAS